MAFKADGKSFSGDSTGICKKGKVKKVLVWALDYILRPIITYIHTLWPL